jgi:hypothetical protein
MANLQGGAFDLSIGTSEVRARVGMFAYLRVLRFAGNLDSFKIARVGGRPVILRRAYGVEVWIPGKSCSPKFNT